MSYPKSGKPSLEDARARIGRANEHIARLKTEAAAIAHDEDRRITIGAGLTGLFIATENRLPSLAAILIGETIYNLHAALDYLAYQLALLDSGKIQEGTYFPLETSPKGWEKHVVSGGYLTGVSNIHKAEIRRLQPFNGVAWSARLVELSSPDKHRHLTVGRNEVAIRVKTYNLEFP